MSITELRNRIAEKINRINSMEKLQEIDEMIEWEFQLDEAGVYNLDHDEMTKVEESQDQRLL